MNIQIICIGKLKEKYWTEQIISEAEEVARKRLAAADVEVDEKWAVIESRLLVMYESHKGLQELVESGIFTVPGKDNK